MVPQLTTHDLKDYYDKYGKKQDSQMFYERKPLSDLLNHIDFNKYQEVFEFGCGTGLFAQILVDRYLGSEGKYAGVDISDKMLFITQERLKNTKKPIKLVVQENPTVLKEEDASYDLFISNFVFDLLTDAQIPRVLEEAYRILRVGGLLCLSGIGRGNTPISKLFTVIWDKIFEFKPSLVGGCRPITLNPYVDQRRWEIQYSNKLISFGIATDVLFLKKV